MATRFGLAGAFLLAAATTAQAPTRRALVGQTVDAEGAPVAGASIVLVGMQTGLPAFGADDVVTATSDDRGRFRVQVRTGLPYCGMAAGTGADGIRRGSAVTGWFGAGAMPVLVLGDEVSGQTTAVRGLEAWAAFGAPRCVARASMGDSYLPMPYELDWPGPLREPSPWPGLPSGILEVRAEDGTVWWWATAPSGARAVVEVPPPRELRCVVVDEKGAPIAGAEIFLRSGSWHDGAVDGIATQRLPMQRLLARTDERGVATAHLPDTGVHLPWPSALLVARAPHRAEVVSGGRGNDRYENDRRVEAFAPDGVRFALPPRERISGRLQGLPFSVEPATAELRVTAKLGASGTGYVHDPRVYSSPIGADDSFSIDHVPLDAHAWQWIVRRGPGLPPLVFEPSRDGQVSAIPAIRIARVTLAVLDPALGPANGRAVYVVRKQAEVGLEHENRIRTVVDSAGRATIDLVPGSWVVRCLDEAGIAEAEIDATKPGDYAVELRLAPFATVRGTVVDGEGKPVSGARFAVRAVSGASSDRLLASWSRRAIARLVGQRRSGADGSFELPLPMWKEQRIVVSARLGDRSSEDFSTTPTENGGDLRVVLR